MNFNIFFQQYPVICRRYFIIEEQINRRSGLIQFPGGAMIWNSIDRGFRPEERYNVPTYTDQFCCTFLPKIG